MALLPTDAKTGIYHRKVRPFLTVLSAEFTAMLKHWDHVSELHSPLFFQAPYTTLLSSSSPPAANFESVFSTFPKSKNIYLGNQVFVVQFRNKKPVYLKQELGRSI